MYLSYLVRVALFGKYYEQVKKNEIVYQTPSVTVIHITSLDRMKSLFSLGGLSSVFIKNATGTMMHSTCGKLSLEIDGKEMNGYILRGSQRGLTVQLENNETIDIRRPSWNSSLMKYDYPSLPMNYDTITSYIPNMFSVSSSGQFKYLINRFTTDRDNKIITNFTN